MLSKRETVEAYTLGALGLIVGIGNVILKPLVKDLTTWTERMADDAIEAIRTVGEEMDIYEAEESLRDAA